VEERNQSRAEAQTRCYAPKLRRSPMCHSGSGLVQGTLRGWVRARAQAQGNLAHSTCPDEAEADGMVDAAGTGNVQEAMYGAWEVDVDGMM
jgi:hypothetical protein